MTLECTNSVENNGGMNVDATKRPEHEPVPTPHPRMYVYERMEALLHQMQDAESGVPVRCQRTFLNTIPSVFTACDLIEWLTERLGIDDTCEALRFSTLLCHYGYFFPVSDAKCHAVKEDSSLFRFQNPSLWPGQKHTPDNTEYAIYLVKRVLKNKPKAALEEYEQEAMARLKSVLSNKWEYIIKQAEDQIKMTKDYKKIDKVVMESQEKAYWRAHRPPPGVTNCSETCPVPNRRPSNTKRRKSKEEYIKEVEYLNRSMMKTRLKTSQALDSLTHNYDVYCEYDPFITTPEPSNPWITDDNSLWLMNNAMAEFPSEKRVRKWAISLKDLLSDPRGQWEFEIYLRKEYSGENLRFWLAVEDLKRGAKILVENRVMEIYNEFLGPGAPNEVNVDGRTIEVIHQNMRIPSRYTYNEAQEHVFNLMKKDSYPRFLRSENYRNILENAGHSSQKKRFTFGFGNKKKNSLTPPDKKEPVDKRRGSSCSDKGKYVDMDGSSGTGGAHDGMGIMDMVKGRMGGQHSLSTSDLLDIDARNNKIQQCSRLSSPSQSKSNINGGDRQMHSRNTSRQLDVPRRSPVSSQSIDCPDPCVSLCVPSTRRKSSTCSNSSNVVAPWEDLDM